MHLFMIFWYCYKVITILYYDIYIFQITRPNNVFVCASENKIYPSRICRVFCPKSFYGAVHKSTRDENYNYLEFYGRFSYYNTEVVVLRYVYIIYCIVFNVYLYNIHWLWSCSGVPDDDYSMTITTRNK